MKYCPTGARDYRCTQVMKTLTATPGAGSVDSALEQLEEGQVLWLYPKKGRPGSCGAKLRRIINACLPARKRFFVVLHAKDRNEPPVLQWAATERQAKSAHPDGSVLISDLTYAAASLLGYNEFSERDPGKQRMCCCRRRRSRKELDFSVVFGDCKLKLRAEDQTSLGIWVTALNDLKSREQPAAMSSEVSPYGHSINQQMAQPNATPADSGEITKSMSAQKNRRTSLMDANEPPVHALKPWFEKYATAQIRDREMSAGDFRLFLRIDQRETTFFDSPSIEGLFQKLTDPYVIDDCNERFLTFAGFCRVMCSAENAAFDPERRARVEEREMTRPLTEYWISSSHNTYLEDDQLVGSSSLEQYVDVLLRGCRCVEIDCWDGEEGEPIVTHGRTLTSSLRFKDVVRVCKDYAFVASPYPLILSLEVRCGPAQKEKMADILKNELGEMLLQGDAQPDTNLTPYLARKKIIIKSRDLKRKSKNGRGSNETLRGQNGSQRSSAVVRRASVDSKEMEEEVESGPEEVVYLASRKLRDFSEKKHDSRTCISLNEDKALAFIRDKGTDKTRDFCMIQLLRIYPRPTRVCSGNFNPMPLWLAGCQMVALNYQILDIPILLNEGLFSHENGGSGYILKPPVVQGPAQLSRLLEDKIPCCPLECELTILSGHRLGRRGSRYSNRAVSPKVRITICGVEKDGQTMETHRIENEVNPRWHRHFELQFLEPTVAMLVFQVINTSEGASKWKSKFRAESLLAYTAFPVSGLREGLRWVPLMDYRHQKLRSSGLLVEVRYRGAWAKEMHKRLDRKNCAKWGDIGSEFVRHRACI